MHWIVLVWLLGIGLISLAALIVPLNSRTLRFLDVFFLVVLLLATMTWIAWAQDQLRCRSQIQEIRPARAGVYLLSAYLLISVLLLAWPYTFVAIFEGRISARAGQDRVVNALSLVDEVREERSGHVIKYPVGLPRCVVVDEQLPQEQERLNLTEDEVRRVRDFQQLFERFGARPPGEPLASSRARLVSCADALRIRISFFGDIGKIEVIRSIAASVGIEGREARPPETRIYQQSFAVSFLLEALVISLLFYFWILQSTVFRSLYPAALLVVAVLALFALIPPAMYRFCVVGLGLFGGSAILQARRLRRKRLLVEMGLHLFSVFIFSAPIWRWVGQMQRGAKSDGSDIGVPALLVPALLGLVLLLLLTPWIQRSYIAYQAAPE